MGAIRRSQAGVLMCGQLRAISGIYGAATGAARELFKVRVSKVWGRSWIQGAWN